MIADGQLLDWARVGAYRHGTPRDPVRSRLWAGQPVLLALDLPGALLIRDVLPDAQLILLAPPGFRPDPATAAAFERTLVHDLVERVADELVGLLGSSLFTPAQPRLSG